MPVCFCLTKKGELAATPLNKIDEELCNLVGIPVNESLYMSLVPELDGVKSPYNWYNLFGQNLASGATWEDLKTIYKDCSEETVERCNKVVDYLESNYVSSAWREV